MSRSKIDQAATSLISLGAAAAHAQKKLPAYEAAVRPRRKALEQGILSTIPNTELHGHATRHLANTSNITFHGIESDALLLLVDQAGTGRSSAAAAGANAITACSASFDTVGNSARTSSADGLSARVNPAHQISRNRFMIAFGFWRRSSSA